LRANVATGLLGAALLLPLELLALGRADGIFVLTITSLMAGFGLAAGIAVAIADAIALRLTERPLLRATVRASASFVATIPLGLHLFDGAKASTLPGAAYAPVLVPFAGWMGIATVLWLIAGWNTTARRSLMLSTTLLGAAFVVDRINCSRLRSEYPDVHTFLLFATIVGGGLGLRLLGQNIRGKARRPDRPWVLRITLAVVALGFCVTVKTGLSDDNSRWAVATRGMHARMVTRLIRGAFDRDRDGYASVLGGQDCNDANARVNPGVGEDPNTTLDDNCDGLLNNPGETERQQENLTLDVVLSALRKTPRITDLVQKTSRMHFVLLSIDALRADVLAATEDNRAAYPNLFGVLDQAHRFRMAFAPSAGTDLSMSGILTGQVDPFHTDEPTLAEALRKQGRTTHAVIPSEVIRYVGASILTRGLDGHDLLVNDKERRDIGTYSTSTETSALGLQFVDRHAKSGKDHPFFLWLHYFDVHEHDELRATDPRVREILGDNPARLRRPDRYRRIVRLVDEQVGVLLSGLRSRGVLEQTLIVVVSDHGEGLGDDPRLPGNHGKFVYNPLVHVPLAIRIPGVSTNSIETAVSILDLHPTLIELAGVIPPPVAGQTLVPHLVPDTPPAWLHQRRPLPLNESDQFGVVVWPYKLMVRKAENLSELYDISTDFGEKTNLSAAQPERARSMLASYRALPAVNVDRTNKGRKLRDRAAQVVPAAR
jgi:arylsulfatase A-like enzyme